MTVYEYSNNASMGVHEFLQVIFQEYEHLTSIS